MADKHDIRNGVLHVASYACKDPVTGLFYDGSADDPNRFTGVIYNATHEHRAGVTGNITHEQRVDVPHFQKDPHDHTNEFAEAASVVRRWMHQDTRIGGTHSIGAVLGDHRTIRASDLMAQHERNTPHRDKLLARCMDIITSGTFSDQDRDIALIALEALTK